MKKPGPSKEIYCIHKESLKLLNLYGTIFVNYMYY